jgi:hypothetical protein
VKKKGLRQILTIFSLFILLVLPTAIIGFTNFSTVVNKAFGKPFRKDSNTFIVLSESSQNIVKNSPFSLKITATAPKALPLKYSAAFIEFDKTKIDVKSVLSQNPKQFAVIEFQNGFLFYPSGMEKPSTYTDLLPKECSDKQLCNISSSDAMSSVSFSINAILLTDLAEQQRPIKITFIGAAETTSTIIWNEKIELPELKLGEYIKNYSPDFSSEPDNYIKAEIPYLYDISTKDADNDPVLLSLECPEEVFCEKAQEAPNGLKLEDRSLSWESPVYRKEPYIVTIYANDGKSVTTQTFQLFVLQKNSSYFTCTFTPAVSVKILDFSIETPLVIVADSTERLNSATVSLKRNNTTEKTFEYTLQSPSKSVILDQNSSPPLIYQFNKGSYSGEALFVSESGERFTCELENPTVSLSSLLKETVQLTVKEIVTSVYAATGLVVGVNNSPSFITDPMLPAASGGSSPSVSFVYGQTYSFLLKAQDIDGDPLQHTIVTAPNWATISASSTNPINGASTYSVQITGTPLIGNTGSNLFAISINDGYGHFITRTWVINIDFPNNDIPRVVLTKPTNYTLPSYCPNQTNTTITLYQGQYFMMVFDATDRNQIMKFGLYYTKDLASTTRTTYDANISYKLRCMSVNTSGIAPGDYYFILTATDSFSPPAVGSAYTNLVRILPPLPKPTVTVTATATPSLSATATPSISTTITPTPTITTSSIPQPNEMLIQITSPQQSAKMKPENFQFVATVTSSKDAEILSSSIVVKLDNVEINPKVTFSTEKGKTITLTYKPSTLLDYAVHEIIVQAKDTQNKTAEAKTTFTIINEDATDTDSVNFLGINIRKEWYTIFMAGLILIGVLVLLPLIMYFAFKSNTKNSTISNTSRPQVPSQPYLTPPQLRTPTSSFASQQPPPTVNSMAPAQRPAYTPAPMVTATTNYTSQPPRFSPMSPIAVPVAQQPSTPQVNEVYKQPTPIVENTKIPVSPSFSPQPQSSTIQTNKQPPVSVVEPVKITPKQALDNFISQSTDSKNKTSSTSTQQQTSMKLPTSLQVSQPATVSNSQMKPIAPTIPASIPKPIPQAKTTPVIPESPTLVKPLSGGAIPTNIPNVVTPKMTTLPPESPALPK